MEVEVRNIRANPAYIQELIAVQARATPTTIVEDTETGARQVIIGFRQPELRQALGLAE